MPSPPPSNPPAFHHKILPNIETPQRARALHASAPSSTCAPTPCALCASTHTPLPSPISCKTLRPPQVDSDPQHILPQLDSTESTTSPLHCPSTPVLQLSPSHSCRSIEVAPSHTPTPNTQVAPQNLSSHFPESVFHT